MTDEKPTGDENLTGDEKPSRRDKFNAWLSTWKPSADLIKLVLPAAVVFVILVSIIVWLLLPTVQLIGTPAIKTDEFDIALDAAITRSAGNFELWYKGNIAIQCTLIMTALLATVFASLTTKDNAESVKKWSVFLTAVTAALAAVLSTFHIRENLDSFIRSTIDLSELQAEYRAARAPIIAEFSSTDGSRTADSEKAIRELQLKFTPKYLNIMSNRMHAWANVGQQSSTGQQSVNDQQSLPIPTTDSSSEVGRGGADTSNSRPR